MVPFPDRLLTTTLENVVNGRHSGIRRSRGYHSRCYLSGALTRFNFKMSDGELTVPCSNKFAGPARSFREVERVWRSANIEEVQAKLLLIALVTR